MALCNDSITVTPGSGTEVATQTIGSKEHQVVMLADYDGTLYGTEPTFILQTANTAHVAAARTTLFDLFNASGSNISLKIWGIFVIPTLVAVTGVGQTYELIRTSAVGTGGTTRTPVKVDTTMDDLPAQVTARVKPTGGATTSQILQYINGSSEETNPYAALASVLNHVGWTAGRVQPITLRGDEGIKIDQTTNSSVGSVNIGVIFSTG